MVKQLGSGEDFDSKVVGIMKNFEENRLPNSISILINFGTGQSHVLYDADTTSHNCTSEQIWDPFYKVCHDIYCAADQILDEYTCKGGSKNSTKEGRQNS